MKECQQAVYTGESIKIMKGDILIPLEPVEGDLWLFWNKANKTVVRLDVQDVFQGGKTI